MWSVQPIDRLDTLDTDLDEITGGESTFTQDQLMKWCAEGKQGLPAAQQELGCVMNVTRNVGSQVAADDFAMFKKALGAK